MKLIIRLFQIAVLGLSLVSCNGTNKKLRTTSTHVKEVTKKKKQFAVDFHYSKSLSTILDKATRENKLVFVDIYTDWCTPCKLMDKDVFTDKATAEYLNKNFISYKVNAERENGPDLNLIFGVQVYPTLLFLNAKGQVLSRKDGAAYHSELLRLASDALQLQAGI